MAVGPFARLKACGMPCAQLISSHRYRMEIAKFLKGLVYEDMRLPLTDRRRKYTELIDDYMADTWDINGPVGLLTIAGLASTYQGSVGNEANIDLGYFILKSLLIRGVNPGDLAYLAPYRAQERLANFMLARLQQDFPAKKILDEVAVSTIDKFQGKERAIFILDWTVKDRLGFLQLKRRVVSGITRGQEALIMIGDRDISNASKWEASFLRAVFRHCEKTSTMRAVSGGDLPMDCRLGLVHQGGVQISYEFENSGEFGDAAADGAAADGAAADGAAADEMKAGNEPGW